MTKTSLQALVDLKAEATRYERDSARLEGAKEQALRKLQADFGVGTVEEAEALCKQLEIDAAKAKSRFEKGLVAYQRDFANREGREHDG